MGIYSHTRFNPTTGEITGHYSLDVHNDPLQFWREDSGIIPGEFYQTSEMIVEVAGKWEAVPRPVNPTMIDKTTIMADGEDTIVLSEVPHLARVSITETGQSIRVKSGVLPFSVDISGTYTLVCSCFPYLDTIFTVEAE